MEKGIEEQNNRTGQKTTALPGITFQVDLQQEFPLLTARKIRIENFVAEMMWFVSGVKNNDFLRSKTAIWDLFLEADGSLPTGYGIRWASTFGRDQLMELLDLLTKDPSSRHGVVMTWDPRTDGLMGPKKKNVPCPVMFTVNIIGGKLHLHNIIRSNDMILGLPTDVAGFAFLQLILAEKLNVEPGIYTHTISNAHIYDNHYGAAEEMINREDFTSIVPPVKMSLDAFDRSLLLEDEFYNELVLKFKKDYKPLPSIPNLLIAV